MSRFSITCWILVFIILFQACATPRPKQVQMLENPHSIDRHFSASGSSHSLKVTSSKPKVECLGAGKTRSSIQHLVIIIPENHSFDSYFGNYCKAPTGSQPTCNDGPSCCEKGPNQVSNISPVVLTDAQNLAFDPNHSQACQLEEINGGLMDHYVQGAFCSHRNNFAYADESTVWLYWQLAKKYAVADHYFQPAAGASSENDMYFARAAWVFPDNAVVPKVKGVTNTHCYASSSKIAQRPYTDPTIGDLLVQCSIPWSFYAEGYQDTLKCTGECLCYPQGYDPSDNPFQYYKAFQDHPSFQKDYQQFAIDVIQNKLPAVSFIKGLGIHSEHPGLSTIQAGQEIIQKVVDLILESPSYQLNTLILIVPDESGGFYDHIAPPPTSTVDSQAYGPRLPVVAVGHAVKSNYISHVTLEHSSIVRFIEWNFLDGTPGQLKTRDATVNNIGDLLDPDKAGIVVPSN